jgi:hypothetical protein
MGLEHHFLYINPDKYSDDIWEKIHYHPLRLENELVSELDYVDIHDDFIIYFYDFLNWIEMYNPAKKEKTYGLCYHGVTLIKNENLKKLAKMIDSIISLFENSPKNIELTGSYECFVKDIIDGQEILTDGKYKTIKINKNKFMGKIIKLENLIEKAINENGYILHHGI